MPSPRIKPLLGAAMGGRWGTDDPSTAAADVDASSGIYVPSTADQFSTLGITAPSHLWLCQEASGNLADSIGAATLVANGAPSYQQTVTGWTRKSVRTAAGTVNQRFTAAAGSGPSPATTSVALLAYVDITATGAATRWVLGMGAATTGCGTYIATTGIPGIRVLTVNANGASDEMTGGVRPILLVYDRTGNNSKVYNDLEVFAGTHSDSVVDGEKGLGCPNAQFNAATADYLWACMWSGAAAEALATTATAKTMLEALGWTIPY